MEIKFTFIFVPEVKVLRNESSLLGTFASGSESTKEGKGHNSDTATSSGVGIPNPEVFL